MRIIETGVTYRDLAYGFNLKCKCIKGTYIEFEANGYNVEIPKDLVLSERLKMENGDILYRFSTLEEIALPCEIY